MERELNLSSIFVIHFRLNDGVRRRVDAQQSVLDSTCISIVRDNLSMVSRIYI